ncbi:hypothetical protein, partial [Mesorhizobium sp.]|uniref:hypothetical protein n=1 Tax=Mesorhizobium sp. TaxID=1871066 RepID=UPI0025C033D3
RASLSACAGARWDARTGYSSSTALSISWRSPSGMARRIGFRSIRYLLVDVILLIEPKQSFD